MDTSITVAVALGAFFVLAVVGSGQPTRPA